MNKYYSFFFTVIALLGLFSCATPQYSVDEVEVQKLKDQKITYLRGSKTRLYIANFVDDRAKQDGIGMVGTGIDNRPTPVYLYPKNQDLGFFTSRFFTKGLITRGLSIAKESEADYVLKASISDFWMHEVATEFATEAVECSASLDYSLVRTKDQSTAWNGKMSLNYRHPGKAFDTTVMTADAMGACLNQLVEKLITLQKLQSILGIEVVK